MAQKIFVAVENSSLFDIALNTYGSLDFIGKLIEDNPGNGLNLYPTAGTQFVWDDSLQISQTNAIIGGSGMFVGQKFATRPTNDPQADYAPENILPPTINGATSIGSTLFAISGAWAGLPTPSLSFQWQSSTDGGVTWSDIVGQIASTYVLVPGDELKEIRVNQIATNALGTAERASAYVQPYSSGGGSSIPPSVSVAPTSFVVGGGAPTIGKYLVLSPGAWNGNGAINFTYEWTIGATVVGIAQVYQIQSSDFGQSIVGKVIATNSFGTANASTAGITAVQIPINTVAPVVSGTDIVGSVLTTTNGTWTGNAPITFTYQWLRNGQNISGETSNTYTSVTSDIGQNITCRVIASNLYGSGAPITTSAVVVTSSPILIQSPVIYGIYLEGSTLTVQNGYYRAQPTETITRKWQFSTDSGSTWNDYSPAQTGTTYTIQTGETGRQIRVLETASNGVGSPLVTASNVATIQSVSAGGGPVISGTPLVTGIAIVSRTLTCSIAPLTITGSPTPTISYQWYEGTNPISGATSSTYVLQPSNSGDKVWCQVTATNTGGTAIVQSNIVNVFLTIADKYTGAWHSGWHPFLLRGAYYGQPLIRVQRASDNAWIDVSHDNNGYLNEALINSHCAGTTGRVTIVYDQFGTNHMDNTASFTTCPIIYQSGAIVKLDGIAVINNQTVTGQILTVPNSASSGTYNFMHNGLLASYSVFFASRFINAIVFVLSTTNNTVANVGYQFRMQTTNAIGSFISNGASLIMSNLSGNNATIANKSYVVGVCNRFITAPATGRSKILYNELAIAANTGTGSPSLSNHFTNMTWGGVGVNQYMSGLIKQDDLFFEEIREALRAQLNINY